MFSAANKYYSSAGHHEQIIGSNVAAVSSTVFAVWSKKVWTTKERASSFIKKALKKQSVNANKKLSIVYYYPLIISNYTNKLFIFEYLLNFTTKCIGGQIKAFSFLFCTACDVKSTKLGQR